MGLDGGDGQHGEGLLAGVHPGVDGPDVGDVVLEVVEVDLGALNEKNTRMKVKLDFAFSGPEEQFIKG